MQQNYFSSRVKEGQTKLSQVQLLSYYKGSTHGRFIDITHLIETGHLSVERFAESQLAESADC